MTHIEKLEAIRKAAILANPEIVDMKFGCEIERKGSERHYKIIEDIGWGANTKKVWINSVPFGSMPIELEKDLIKNGGDFKIIGRNIQLADILAAISEKEKFKASPRALSVHGGFYENGVCLAQWNLVKPLEEQEETTIDFIHGLLEKKV